MKYNNTELLTKKEAAFFLKVHVSTIDNYRRRGILNVYKTKGGRIALFKKSELLAMLQSS